MGFTHEITVPPRPTRRFGRPSGRVFFGLTGALVVLGGGLALAGFVSVPWGGGAGGSELEGAPVRRGPLKISAIASGSLKAAQTVRLTSGIEGRTTILSLAPEGVEVKEGEIVCELDATAMVEQRIEQSIETANASAALVKATQVLEIQQSQNKSDVNKARLALAFAQQDLEMFLEGERALELEKAQQAIDLAKEDAQRAREQHAWSAKLADRGFLTAIELEADRIAVHRAEVELRQAEGERELMDRFRMQRRESELRGALEEAEQEFARVELQAKARLVDFESDVRTSGAALELEKEKLARLEAQIEKAKLRAPRDGYVVYAQRDNDEPPIAEGAEVREREEILSIPSSEGMIVELKLHESVLKQVVLGQSCEIEVDALPGLTLDGKVQFVAMLPDQQSRWSNPNLRLYRANVSIDTQHPGLRPGMSCAVEILMEEIADALYVPVQAVFRDRETNLSFVAKRSGVERRVVKVGRYNDLWVQVLEGLAEGEVVLLHAPPGFEPTRSKAEEEEEEAEGAGERPSDAERERGESRDDEQASDGPGSDGSRGESSGRGERERGEWEGGDRERGVRERGERGERERGDERSPSEPERARGE